MTFYWSLAGSVLFVLAGCVGQDSFRRGEEQIANRQWEPAINSFSEASQRDPSNLEYRTALLRANEKAVNELLAEASTLREKNTTQAGDLYQRVLRLSPTNERAVAGLQSIQTEERRRRLFDDATRAAGNGREQEARTKFRKLLDEVPNHSGARQALRNMDESLERVNVRPELAPALRKPVSLAFRDATLKMVFDALASATGINFVFDRDFRSDTRVNVFLRNVAFDEAIEQIVSSNGLARRVVNANTLLIYPALPNKTREYQDLVVRNIFVANADVKQLSTLLKTVLRVKDLHTDEKRNVIVIRDTPEIVAMAAKMVAAHDQPEPEVMLEVEILEFNHTKDNNLGIKFPDQVSFGVASPITLNALRAINDDGISVSGLNSAVAINLKRQVGSINLLANPRIRVRNREKAKFHIGDKVPVITSTTYPGTTIGATSSSVAYLEVGIKLEFEPSIQLDDDVVIKTTLEVSSITKEVVNAGTIAYQVGTRNAATTLTLRDGETQVLAGLLSSDESDTADRFPGLGDIPLLGGLFTSRSVKGARKEILLSITPRIVRNLRRPTEDLLEFNFGPEAGQQGSGQTGGVPPRPSSPVPVLPTRPQPSTSAPSSGLIPVVPFGTTTLPSSAPLTTPAQPAAAATAPSVGSSPQLPAENSDLPPGVGSR